jgi:hypothetical protein
MVPGSPVRLRCEIRVLGTRRIWGLLPKGARFFVVGTFRGNVEVRRWADNYTLVLPAKLLEGC